MKEISQQTKRLPFLIIIVEAVIIVVLIVVLIGKSRDNSVENVSNDTTKENVENETTTNKKTDDNDIFIPDVAEKEIIKKSLGLGLSIVKHSAAFLGAEVMLESEENKGTKVTIKF